MATTAFEIGNPDGVKGHALSSYSVGCSSPWGSGWGSRIIPSPVIKVPISHIRGQRSAGRATVSTNLWGVVKNLGNALTIAKDSLIRGLDYSEIPDVAAYQDVQQQWNYGYREMLEAAIHDGNCRPTHMDIADYPKNSVSVRPLTRFSARDRLIYDALVFTMASQIDININPSVHSSRWDHGRGNLLFWYYPWNHAWGLPQDSEASGILANLYPAPVDEYLRQNDFRFLRYSDDVMIFHRDWSEFRDALIGVTRVLRARRLSVASHKTQILDPEDSIEYIHDARRASIQYAYDTGVATTQDDVRRYFDELIKSDRTRSHNSSGAQIPPQRTYNPSALKGVLK